MDKLYSNPNGIQKSRTGIQGLDEITGGGLPTGRPTLVCGSAGCGKTLMSMEFLVRGATLYDEPGLFVAFEEKPQELAANVASLGFDLAQLEADGKLMLDHIHLDSNEIEQSGEYDLEGLFVRLNYQIDAIGAKRVVIDTIETLFTHLSDSPLLRSEMLRLFRWLKEKGVTAIITGERGEGSLTRNGLEEYISDCVILLDHRVLDQISTRRLRIVKYRGTSHGTNEYPFLIDRSGFAVLPVTSMDLYQDSSDEMVSSGSERLDTMLGGGYYRGSSILFSGSAGTGKTTLLCQAAMAACQRGERALYFSFEESPGQILRNMRKVGMDLKSCVEKGLLTFHSARPQLYGLEMHLVNVHRLMEEFQPHLVIMDPVSSLMNAGTTNDASLAMLRLIDILKSRQVTTLVSYLSSSATDAYHTDLNISSLMDTWLLLRNLESHGERNRGLYVMKSRGAQHSNQIREFVITPQGIELLDVYVGSEGVLAGTARMAQESREAAEARIREEVLELKQRELERKRHALEARIEEMRADFEAQEVEVRKALQLDEIEVAARTELRAKMGTARMADTGSNG